ncbi:MAG: zf-HC2 domain-containing protein [Deltaproteobacteria bacterium]|nr:zf-HC2 domain-containing protein [Deltaproteobacteria bacterium]
MNCKELKELILEYTAGNLDQSEKLRVESHLKECKECYLFFGQSNQVWDLLDEWDIIEPKEDIVTNFWERVSEEEIRGKGIFDFFKNLKLNWSFGVALAVIMIISVISFNIFEFKRTKVVFTENDKADEELLIELDRAVSRKTARGLDIYGPWEDEIEENDKGG